MADDFINLLALLGRNTQQIKIEQAFIEVKETQHGILPIHGWHSLDTDIEQVRCVAMRDILLDVTRLRLHRSTRHTGSAGKLAHDHAVAAAADRCYGVERTIDTEANPDIMAFILDVDVARTKHIRLVDQEVENLLTAHSPKCLTHLSDGLAIARFGNLNIIVDDLLWRIKAVHQHAVSTKANQIKFDR